jgi:type I restriction enzyme S subunit
MKSQDLKNSILQLAVQGKLVPQDPSDESASKLLERIREERAELIEQKKIKKPKGGESVIYREGSSWYERRGKSDPVCIDDEIPFDIPKGWAWARFTEIVPVQYGFAANSQLFSPNGKIGLIRIRDVNSGDLIHTTVRYNGDFDKQYLVHSGDDLIGMDGEFRCKRWMGSDSLLNQRVCMLRYISDTVCTDFIRYAVNWYLAEVWKVTSKTTVKHLSAKALDALLFAIPPLEEQRRIIERVDELMPLVEKYGMLEDAREKLDAELPGRLRKSVLQLAVQGKLVPQDPSDEPAGELLARIRKERAELVKQREIRRPKGGESVIYREGESWYERRGKSEPACIDDEIPFDIPESWEWARLETVTSYIQRGKSPRYSNIEKYPVVAQKCNQWSGFSLKLAKFIDPDTVASYAEERILRDGDLLWNSTGIGTLGRMAVYDSRVNKYGWAVADSHVTVIRTKESWLDFRFAYLYFAGPSVQLRIEDQASGSTKQKELTQETVRNYLIPIPPHEEQRRIVEKANTLLELIGTEESWMTR